MKRVKIMLAAITIITVVGSALAFKAKTFNQCYCTRDISLGPGTCEGYFCPSKIVSGIPNVYAVETTNTANCTTQTCDTKIRLIAD